MGQHSGMVLFEFRSGNEMKKQCSKKLGKVSKVHQNESPHGEYKLPWIVVRCGSEKKTFGGLAVAPESLQDFWDQVTSLFGAQDTFDLIKRECLVLECWGRIVGLENPKTGAQFTVQSWYESQGHVVQSPLQEREESLRRQIREYERMLESCRYELSQAASEYDEFNRSS